MYRSILGYDTSVINALHRDGPSAEPLLAGLSAGYAVSLNGITLDEIVAHNTMAERERLRKLCRRMLANGEGDVLLPYHEITKRLAVAAGAANRTNQSIHPTSIPTNRPKAVRA